MVCSYWGQVSSYHHLDCRANKKNMCPSAGIEPPPAGKRLQETSLNKRYSTEYTETLPKLAIRLYFVSLWIRSETRTGLIASIREDAEAVRESCRISEPGPALRDRIRRLRNSPRALHGRCTAVRLIRDSITCDPRHAHVVRNRDHFFSRSFTPRSDSKYIVSGIGALNARCGVGSAPT